MKTVVLALFVLTSAVATRAQGTIWFINMVAPVLDAPVFLSDGVTKVTGNSFHVELLVGPTLDSLMRIATTGFLPSPAASGYFNGGPCSVPTVQLGDLAWVKVRVFDQSFGSTFDQAQASQVANTWGESASFQLRLGGGTLSPPTPLLGLTSFSLNGVPEPSALALVALGSASLLLRRR